MNLKIFNEKIHITIGVFSNALRVCCSILRTQSEELVWIFLVMCVSSQCTYLNSAGVPRFQPLLLIVQKLKRSCHYDDCLLWARFESCFRKKLVYFQCSQHSIFLFSDNGAWYRKYFHLTILYYCYGHSGHRTPRYLSWSHITTDGRPVSQSVSTSRCWTHCGTCDQILILSEFCCLVSVGHPLWREVGSVSCHSLSAVIVHRAVSPPPILHVKRFMYIKYMQDLVSPGSVQQIMLHHL
jgi:hypothetical protein